VFGVKKKKKNLHWALFLLFRELEIKKKVEKDSTPDHYHVLFLPLAPRLMAGPGPEQKILIERDFVFLLFDRHHPAKLMIRTQNLITVPNFFQYCFGSCNLG
jgi:hypothetical protein